jgi:hypothetical protein
MPKLSTKQEFIEKAVAKHGNKYDYSHVNYTNGLTEVKIICPEHGEFYVKPQWHLQQSICPWCSEEKRKKSLSDFNKKTKRLTNKEFIDKAILIHNTKYDYSLVSYETAFIKVKIVCPIHGEFLQSPTHHLRGSGCKECGKKKINKNKILTQEQFIDRIKDIPNLSFEKTIYKDKRSKVIVTCKIHGDYETTAEVLLKGNGCKKCALSNGTSRWTYTEWEIEGLKSKHFDNFKLYVIRCYNDTEEFIKIGKTYNILKRRFRGNNMPYKYEILNIIIGKARFISNLETKLKQENKHKQYKPKIKFGGHNECFSINCNLEL